MIKQLEKWQCADNYLGEDLKDYYIVCGQHRDSEYYQQSNFIIATQRLGGEHDPEVIIARFGHWAVGWVENLLVHENAKDKVDIALEIVNDIEDGVVLDFDHYSELKSDEVYKLIDEMKSDIVEGNAKYWSNYGVTGEETDGELWDIADAHVN